MTAFPDYVQVSNGWVFFITNAHAVLFRLQAYAIILSGGWTMTDLHESPRRKDDGTYDFKVSELRSRP